MLPKKFCLPPDEFNLLEFNNICITTELYLKHEVRLEFLVDLFRLGLDDLDVFLHLLLGCLICPAAVVLRANVSPQAPEWKTLNG